MATIGDQINGALRLIGQLAEGESPSAETAQDALTAFNQMIDSWSIDRLNVFYTEDQVFTWPANDATRTFGPSGADHTGNRPVQVMDSTYFKSGNLSYPLALINQDQYNAIALKTSTSTWPQVLWVNMGMPNITLTVWPIPTGAIEFHLVSVVQLVQATTLATELIIPPGYLRAFRFNLAVEIANEFGVEAPPTVKSTAAKALRSVKRINNPDDLMSMPSQIVSRNPRFNIFTGQPY